MEPNYQEIYSKLKEAHKLVRATICSFDYDEDWKLAESIIKVDLAFLIALDLATPNFLGDYKE